MTQKESKLEFVFFVIIMLFYTVYEYDNLQSYSNLVFEDVVSAYSAYYYPVMLFMIALCVYLIKREKNLIALIKSNSFVHFYTGYLIYVYVVGLLGSIYYTDLIAILINAIKISLPLLLFVVFYILSIKIKDEKKLLFVIALSFFVLVYGYYKNYQNRTIYEMATPQTITSYFILYMLPLLMCTRNKILKLLYIVVAAIVVLSSLKKTGTIGLILGLYIYFLVSSLSSMKSKANWWKFIVLILIMVIAAFGINYWFSISDAGIASRMSRLGDEGVNSRTEVWIPLVERIINSNPLAFLFGHGYDAVGILSNDADHLSAHNDFLEVLYDFGFGAFCAYCTIYLRLFVRVRRGVRQHSNYAAPLAMSAAILFISSMSSHIAIIPFFGVIFSLSWAFILAKTDKELNKIQL